MYCAGPNMEQSTMWLTILARVVKHLLGTDAFEVSHACVRGKAHATIEPLRTVDPGYIDSAWLHNGFAASMMTSHALAKVVVLGSKHITVCVQCHAA